MTQDANQPSKIGYVVYLEVSGAPLRFLVQEFDDMADAEEFKAVTNRTTKNLSVAVGVAFHHQHEDEQQERIEIRPKDGGDLFNYTDMAAIEELEKIVNLKPNTPQ